MDGRTDGRRAFASIPFFFVLFGSRARGGSLPPSQPIRLWPGRAINPDSDLFSFTLCVSVSLLCRFSSCVLIKIPIFLLVVRCVGEEIKLARVGVYIGVLDLPWIGP